uniref:Uncharacterized protein n=1 Tax=Anopheles minimus TaxID=112268 RepID=A0A182WPA0_9DIPT
MSVAFVRAFFRFSPIRRFNTRWIFYCYRSGLFVLVSQFGL